MKRSLLLSAAIAVLSFSSLRAAPILQLYIEGALYNDITESWELTSAEPFRLWTVGNVSGPGGAGTIEDVKLSIAYDSLYDPSFTLTSLTTGGFGGIVDPSIADDAIFLQTVSDGSSPLLGDGDELSAHGIFGEDITWAEYYLGDFSLTDSTIGDFTDDFPIELTPDAGQINVYEISVFGDDLDGMGLHFDLYNHVVAGNHINYKFAPFSHDADGFTTIVTPEPTTMVMMSIGIGVAAFAHRRRKNRGPGNVPTDDEITEAIDER
jgi:hypothetical protein